MRLRPFSSTLARLLARKREGRKIQLGNSLLLGIGGATTGGLLWQYHERGSGQIGDIFLQVGQQATSQLILKYQVGTTNPVLTMLAHLQIPGSD